MGQKLMAVKLGIVSVLVGLSIGCATSEQKQAEKKVDAEMKSEMPVTQQDELAVRGQKAFLNAPGLNDQQKQKLNEIHIKAMNDSREIRDELGKAKTVLFKTLAQPNYKKTEIQALKKKIVSLDRKRLDVMFKALDEVQKVVGKGQEAQGIFDHFNDFDHSAIR